MSAVRTNPSSFAAGAIAFGALVAACSKHGVLLRVPRGWSLDTMIILIAIAALGFAAVFGVLHGVLKYFDVSSRKWYSAAGAAASFLCFGFFIDWSSASQLLLEGRLILTLAIPVIVGGIIGFAYHVGAGYTEDGDDPATLSDMLSGFGASVPGNAGGGLGTPRGTGRGSGIRTVVGFGEARRKPEISDDAAYISTGTAEYFDGPLVVRTSVFPMLLAGLIGTVAAYMTLTFITMTGGFMMHGGAGPVSSLQAGAAIGQTTQLGVPPEINALFGGLIANWYMALLFGVVSAVPVACLVGIGHLVARTVETTSYLAYAAIGFAVPVVLGFLSFFLLIVLGIQLAVPCAIAMVVYRKYAGLEPKEVQEDIVVTDRRNLVGANHARRRYGRVVQG